MSMSFLGMAIKFAGLYGKEAQTIHTDLFTSPWLLLCLPFANFFPDYLRWHDIESVGFTAFAHTNDDCKICFLDALSCYYGSEQEFVATQ